MSENQYVHGLILKIYNLIAGILDPHRKQDGYIDSDQGSNKNFSKLSILRKDQCISLKHGPIIHSVFAGRGFHWQKQIPVQLPGNIIIKIRDGFLFTVNKVPLEQYLMCVATSEMSAKCPGALLEVQTIVARSWILAASEQKHLNPLNFFKITEM